MYLSQLLYILGIELSGVTVATCMQPAIPVSCRRRDRAAAAGAGSCCAAGDACCAAMSGRPLSAQLHNRAVLALLAQVFTVLLGIALRMEHGNPRKLTGGLSSEQPGVPGWPAAEPSAALSTPAGAASPAWAPRVCLLPLYVTLPRPPSLAAGIGLAVAGAICMVAGGAASASHAPGVTEAQADNMLLGDFCLLINTLAMAVYYVVSKQMVARYPPICVAAWAYLVGGCDTLWLAAAPPRFCDAGPALIESRAGCLHGLRSRRGVCGAGGHLRQLCQGSLHTDALGKGQHAADPAMPSPEDSSAACHPSFTEAEQTACAAPSCLLCPHLLHLPADNPFPQLRPTAPRPRSRILHGPDGSRPHRRGGLALPAVHGGTAAVLDRGVQRGRLLRCHLGHAALTCLAGEWHPPQVDSRLGGGLPARRRVGKLSGHGAPLPAATCPAFSRVQGIQPGPESLAVRAPLGSLAAAGGGFPVLAALYWNHSRLPGAK